ncbi:MAG: universal stress protein, partial [Polyangiaceae bacterium]
MTTVSARMSTIPPSGSEERPATVSHVLVCLDRSGASEGCLPYAAFAAKAFGARVTLLHVLLTPQVTEFNRADALEAEIGRREAEGYLDRATASLGLENAGTVGRLAQGFPAEQIAVVAREVGADLTILSSHGKGDSVAPELGSIAQHVLSSVDGSVLLVQPTSHLAIPPRRIMVPLDGSVRSECVLPMATAMARANGAEVLLVYIVREPTATAVLSDPEDM